MKHDYTEETFDEGIVAIERALSKMEAHVCGQTQKMANLLEAAKAVIDKNRNHLIPGCFDLEKAIKNYENSLSKG